MRPTDIARALITVLLVLALVPSNFPQSKNATLVKSVTCMPKNGAALEREFCAAVTKQMSAYKPNRVAPNRTLSQTSIEFAAWSDGERITLSSVLVTDPIGKNTMKLMFAPPVGVSVAASRTLVALGQILEVPATRLNAGWIVTVPVEPPRTK